MPSFGQYGVVFIIMGFWGAVLGAFGGAMRSMGRSLWLAFYIAILFALLTIYRGVIFGYGITSVFTVSLAIVAGLIPLPPLIITQLERGER